MRLTIAIPSLNSERTLHITMKSILNQDINKFKLKVILIDSGSRDNTKEIFLSYKHKLDLIFKNVGQCSIGEARNYAIKNIECDYFIFLDSDDALVKNRISNDFKLLNEFPNLSFIYGDSLQINKKSFKNSYYCKASNVADKYQFLNIPFNLSSITISKKFLMKNKINFKEGRCGRLGEDWRFINQINYFENYLYDPLPKVIINSREDSHTQDHLKSDLNITRVEFLCDLFNKTRLKRNLFWKLSSSAQIQSSFFLALINLILNTNLNNVNLFYKNIRKIIKFYRKISFSFHIINIFLIPVSIYLIIFIHRRSIFSPQRKKLSFNAFKYNSSLLNE